MKDDGLILSFDTATSRCSIALIRGDFRDGQIIASLSLSSSITHSRRLLSAIDWLLQESSLDFNDIAAVAVGLGPGSFTGLRIGMATAKGLAHGTGKPLIGIASLDVVAASVHSGKLICAVLDARKKEVYSCFYRCDGNGIARRCTEPAVSTPERLAGNIAEPVVLVGDGVAAYHDILADVLGDKMEEAEAHKGLPSAELLGFLAIEHLRAGTFLDLAAAAPLYVRSSDKQLSLAIPKTVAARPLGQQKEKSS